jgi:hypothetical protein
MGKVMNPAKRKTKGRTTPLTPNQEPTTARGLRRSKNTEEYAANRQERSHMSSPGGKRGARGRGPFKGPSKRPGGIRSEDWNNYMSGLSNDL